MAESIAAIGCDAVSLDWTMDIGRARRLVGDKGGAAGNLDPNVLFARPRGRDGDAGVLDAWQPSGPSSTSVTASRNNPPEA